VSREDFPEDLSSGPCDPPCDCSPWREVNGEVAFDRDVLDGADFDIPPSVLSNLDIFPELVCPDF
jgi:hypothetical protein